MTSLTGSTAGAYRRDIDGLRALAVSSVVLYHAGFDGLSGGFAGVDIFFVISGYLIGSIIYRGVRDQTFTFSDFYARRARRIVPALLAVVLFTMTASTFLLSPGEYEEAAKSGGSALAALSNIRFWRSIGYFSPTADFDPFLMTWSLGVEEQFYIFFPIVLLALRCFNAATNMVVIGLICATSLALSWMLTARMPTAAFYLLPPRAWELGAGVLLAIHSVSGGWLPSGRTAEITSAAGVLSLGAAISLFNVFTAWPGYAALVPVMGTIALIASPGALVNRIILSARPVVAVGLISYSWYLWHWPLMTLLRVSAASTPSSSSLLIIAAASLFIAALSWRYIERPFRTSVLPSRTVNIRYGAVIAYATAVLCCIIIFRGLPARMSPEVAAVDRAVTLTHRYPCLVGSGNQPNFANCVVQTPGRPIIAVIGDSHAAALAPGIVAAANHAGYGSAVLTKSSCRPLGNVTVYKADDASFAADCLSFMLNSLDWAERNQNVRTVLLAGLWDGPIFNETEVYQTATGSRRAGNEALLVSGISSVVARLHRVGKRVLVAEDTPYWQFDPARARLSSIIPARRFLSQQVDVAPTRPYRSPSTSIERRMKGAVEAAGGRYLPLWATFCRSGRCSYETSKDLMFADHSHLSDAGAKLAVSTFKDKLF